MKSFKNYHIIDFNRMVVFTKLPSESVAKLFPRGKIRDFQRPESRETDSKNMLFAC